MGLLSPLTSSHLTLDIYMSYEDVNRNRYSDLLATFDSAIDKAERAIAMDEEKAKQDQKRSSVFLKAMYKNLCGMRSQLRFRIDQETNTAAGVHKHNLADRIAGRANRVKLYVSLYSQDAKNGDIAVWENLINNLTGNTIIGRHIYGEEAHAKMRIKNRPQKGREAYCIIYVPENEIKRPEKNEEETVDENDNPLVTLKTCSVGPEHIHSFFYNNLHYNWDWQSDPKSSLRGHGKLKLINEPIAV